MEWVSKWMGRNLNEEQNNLNLFTEATEEPSVCRLIDPQDDMNKTMSDGGRHLEDRRI